MMFNKNTQLSNQKKDRIFKNLFFITALISSGFIVVIILFVFVRGIIPFLPNYEYGQVDIFDFLTGFEYRSDTMTYGVLFIVINTVLSCFYALIIAFPQAVLTALYITKIAPKKLSSALESVIQLLASIPSIVYGVIGAALITKLVKQLASNFGQSTYGGSSLLAVTILLAIMIFPTICALSISSIRAVNKTLEEASLALGATTTQTNYKIVLKSASSGIFAGAILGVGRALGEATAVSMVAGNKLFGPTFDLFDITRTLTSTMLAGLKETTGLDYDIRFSIGIVLMFIILLTNFLLNYLKKWVAKR